MTLILLEWESGFYSAGFPIDAVTKRRVACRARKSGRNFVEVYSVIRCVMRFVSLCCSMHFFNVNFSGRIGKV